MFLNTRTSGDDGDDSDISGVYGGVSDVRVVSGNVSGSGRECVELNVEANGADGVTHAEVRDEESDAKCDLNRIHAAAMTAGRVTAAAARRRVR